MHKFSIGDAVCVRTLMSKMRGKITKQDESYGLPTYLVKLSDGNDLCVHEAELERVTR